MNQVYEKVEKWFEVLRKKTDFAPTVGVVRGGG